MGTLRLRLERAFVDGAVRPGVVVTIADGRFVQVEVGGSTQGATDVPGLVVPGIANTHSHAFHRGLRGRTQRGTGSFWTWREQMYALAARLNPDSYYRLARATFAEMAACGYTSVGEFHYLHHGPGGRPYAEANAMGLAVVRAARDVGMRIALLDTAYLAGGFGVGVEGVQERFSDGSAGRWAERFAALVEHPDLADLAADRDSVPSSSPGSQGSDPDEADEPPTWAPDKVSQVGAGTVVGAAIHSVRAVPAPALGVIADAARGRPLHAHVSEQPAENEACLAAHAVTPTSLLVANGVLGELTTLVHATHLTRADIDAIGAAGTFVSLCPTTEADLGDGIGPASALAAAGARITFGSDSQAVIDPFTELRSLEWHERLASGRRGIWRAADLLTTAAENGQASLGFGDAGRIAPAYRADLVVLDPDSPRLAGAGADEAAAVFAATAADVAAVMIDGRWIARADDRPRIAEELTAAIGAVWANA